MNNLTPTSQKHGKGEAEDGEQSSHMRIMAGNMGDGDPEKPTSVGHEHLTSAPLIFATSHFFFSAATTKLWFPVRLAPAPNIRPSAGPPWT